MGLASENGTALFPALPLPPFTGLPPRFRRSGAAHVFRLQVNCAGDGGGGGGGALELRALNAKQKTLWQNAIRTCKQRLDSSSGGSTATAAAWASLPGGGAAASSSPRARIGAPIGAGPASPVVSALRQSAAAERQRTMAAEHAVAAAADAATHSAM